MKEIVMATNNQDKVKEMQSLFADLNIEVKALKDVFEEPIEVEETGTTFAENAKLKAETISKMLNRIVIADDSGLEIDALNKEPGVHSARFLGHDTSYDIKNSYLIELLRGQTNRSARYVCAMAMAVPGQETIICQDTMEGEIALKPEGKNGFGYDPIFFFPPAQKTAAMMDLAEKNQYSHRAKATRQLLEKVKELMKNA